MCEWIVNEREIEVEKWRIKEGIRKYKGKR
jgi:hypothetical protein